MFLKVFGKYGPYPKEGCGTSGYMLCDGQTRVAFEMGAGVFSRISGDKPENLSAVIISHFHNDHISDLGVFNYYLEYLFGKDAIDKKMKLFVPSFAKLPEYIADMKYFEIIPVDDGDEAKIGELEFSFFKVAHSVPCMGFSAKGEKKFVYSGDTDLCPSLTREVMSADFALVDGAFLPRQARSNAPHACVADVVRLSEQTRAKILITHLMPDNEVEEYAALLRGRCELANEGQIYRID